MSKSPRVQGYNFSCITYLSPEQFHAVFSRKDSQIKHYAYAYHDKDVWTVEDEKHNKAYKAGMLKTPHYHLVVCLRHAINLSTFLNWFRGYYDEDGKAINTLAEVTRSVVVSYRYLIHADDPDKFQYPDSVVVATDHSYFNDETLSDTDPVWEWVEMVLNGTPLREVARISGRDFIYHYNAVRVLVNDIRAEESREMGRKVDSFYRGEDVEIDL